MCQAAPGAAPIAARAARVAAPTRLLLLLLLLLVARADVPCRGTCAQLPPHHMDCAKAGKAATCAKAAAASNCLSGIIYKECFKACGECDA